MPISEKPAVNVLVKILKTNQLSYYIQERLNQTNFLFFLKKRDMSMFINLSFPFNAFDNQ